MILKLLLPIFLSFQLNAETKHLKSRYLFSGPCVTPSLLDLNRDDTCLIPLDPDKERIALPTYRVIEKLKEAGFGSIQAKSGRILFERAHPRRYPHIEAAIRSRYQKRYPTLQIHNLSIIPTGALKRKKVSTRTCELRLPESNLKKSRGTAILVCNGRHYYLRYQLSAVLPVYKALHQIKKDKIITATDVGRETVRFDRFIDEPLTEMTEGLVARRRIRSGEIIGRNMVMPIPAVRKHNRVHATFREGGVTVEFDATALQNGSRGDMVTIRRDDGKTLRAVVTGKGKVEIR